MTCFVPLSPSRNLSRVPLSVLRVGVTTARQLALYHSMRDRLNFYFLDFGRTVAPLLDWNMPRHLVAKFHLYVPRQCARKACVGHCCVRRSAFTPTKWTPSADRPFLALAITTMSCTSCRWRKLKCDRARPCCGTCCKLRNECQYLERKKKIVLKTRSVKQLEARLGVWIWTTISLLAANSFLTSRHQPSWRPRFTLNLPPPPEGL